MARSSVSRGTVEHSSVYFTTADSTLRRVYGSYVEGAHVALLSNGALIFEALQHLDRLPPRGAFFLGLPLNIEEGTGSPLRAVAFVPKSNRD